MSYFGDISFGTYAGQDFGYLGANTAPVAQVVAPLEKGMKGPNVVALQNALTRKGFPVQPDGDFGNQTKSAVIAFQRQKGLGNTTGKVDTHTAIALNEQPRPQGQSSGQGPNLNVSQQQVTDAVSWLSNVFGKRPAQTPAPAQTPYVPQPAATTSWQTYALYGGVGVVAVLGLVSVARLASSMARPNPDLYGY